MNKQSKLGVAAHTCDPCTYEAEAGDLPEVRDQPSCVVIACLKTATKQARTQSRANPPVPQFPLEGDGPESPRESICDHNSDGRTGSQGEI